MSKMKLIDDLFKVTWVLRNDSGFSAAIKIFPGHIVYKGHFPGYPVTPGVILIQIIHELIEMQLGKTIRLVEMSSCKFLKIVSPDKGSEVTLSIDLALRDRTLHVKALGENYSGVF